MTKQLVKKYLYDLDIYNTFDGLTIEEVVNNLLTIKKNIQILSYSLMCHISDITMKKKLNFLKNVWKLMENMKYV